jgi:hypothetical protein
MGADEALRLGALPLSDDQYAGDPCGGVGHGARGAGRQGMATAARVPGCDGPRWFGGSIGRRQLLDPLEGRVEHPIRRGLERVSRGRRNVGQIASELDI